MAFYQPSVFTGGFLLQKFRRKTNESRRIIGQSKREEKAALISGFIIENSSDIEYAIQTQDRKLLEEIIDDWLGDEE